MQELPSIPLLLKLHRHQPFPRKHKKTAPWILKIPETNVDLAKYPKDQTISIEHRNNNYAVNIQTTKKYTPTHSKLTRELDLPSFVET